MNKEFSAGAVVFRRNPGEILFLVVYSARNKIWGFPKGHLDPGETENEAAVREIKEETGLANLRFIDGFAEKAAYETISKRPPFKGERIEKYVTYFLCETNDLNVVVDGREISDYRFLSLNKAEQAVKFRNLKIILRKAYDFLSLKGKFCIIIFGLMSLVGCSVIKGTGTVIGVAGKTVYTTAKVTGKVISVTANAAGKGVRTTVNMATGKHTVKLIKRGNSFAANVSLNRKINVELIVDTGATETIISSSIAKRIGVSFNKGQDVLYQVADGRTVSGKQVNIREVKVGGAKVYNVQAVVLDSGETGAGQGLLGMSFLNNFIFKIDTEKGLLVLQKR